MHAGVLDALVRLAGGLTALAVALLLVALVRDAALDVVVPLAVVVALDVHVLSFVWQCGWLP